MLYPGSKRTSTHLRLASLFLLSFFIIAAEAQNDAVLIIKGQTILRARAKGLGGNVGVSSVNYKEEALEGVDIEVKKNDVSILKTKSEKKGKYSFQVPVSTTDTKNDFVVYFSREGMAPRMIHINGFLPKEEFEKYSAAKYECEVDARLYATTVTDIVPDKAFAKVKWDKVKEHKFTIDPMYAKTSLAEDRKIDANPDAYYAALVKKQKKLDDKIVAKNKAAAEAKLKAAEEARKKAEEEAQRLAAIKAKEEADRIEREKAEAARLELLKKHIADSLAELARLKALETAGNATVEIKQIIRPAGDGDEGKDGYNAAETYSIHVARRSLSAEKEKKSREKAYNLSAKYETINTLTSLLNMVDEHDKKR